MRWLGGGAIVGVELALKELADEGGAFFNRGDVGDEDLAEARGEGRGEVADLIRV